MKWIGKLIDSITERGREIWQQENPAGSSSIRSIDRDCAELLTRKGDAVAMAIARHILARYRQLNEHGKLDFFTYLLNLRPDYQALSIQFKSLETDESPQVYQQVMQDLNIGRRTLFELLNVPGEGTRALIDMRADLLPLLKQDPRLRMVDNDLQSILQSWFNRGFLEFHSIDWNTPAAILEKLIQYEAVHEISDWSDLKRRLADDRDCFAFFHPSLPGEPLIFVQVAYVDDISDSISPFLDHQLPVSDPTTARAAIFYSISNCQAGLKGISFGNFLIKQVVQHIQGVHPNIRWFSTLSPMPGLANAVRSGVLDEAQLVFLAGNQAKDIRQLASDQKLSTLLVTEYQNLDNDQPHVRDWLEAVGLHYLSQVKKMDGPYDPVARFHLSNGASIFRINPFANARNYGLKSSAGLMVNYLYDLDRVEMNHEQFKQTGAIDILKTARKQGRRLKGAAA